MKFNHFGIPTAGSFDGEIPLPHLKMTVSDHQANPFGIQWQRYWDGAPYPDLVKSVPHVAFEVDDLTAALAGQHVIIEPNSPSRASWSPSSRSAGRRWSSCRSTTRLVRTCNRRSAARGFRVRRYGHQFRVSSIVSASVEQDICFAVDGTKTYGTLEIPAHRSGQHLAAALLLAGSGPTDRDGDAAVPRTSPRSTLKPGRGRRSPGRAS